MCILSPINAWLNLGGKKNILETKPNTNCRQSRNFLDLLSSSFSPLIYSSFTLENEDRGRGNEIQERKRSGWRIARVFKKPRKSGGFARERGVSHLD